MNCDTWLATDRSFEESGPEEDKPRDAEEIFGEGLLDHAQYIRTAIEVARRSGLHRALARLNSSENSACSRPRDSQAKEADSGIDDSVPF